MHFLTGTVVMNLWMFTIQMHTKGAKMSALNYNIYNAYKPWETWITKSDEMIAYTPYFLMSFSKNFLKTLLMISGSSFFNLILF